MKVVFLFPSYGSQFVGMGKELYDASRIMQEYFEQASNCLDQNFVKLCFASSDVELSKIENAYTSIFLVSSAIYAELASRGIKPDIVAGYNIGEFAAMHAAGALSLPDGLYLLHKFAQFYKEFIGEHKYLILEVTGLSAESLEELTKQSKTYIGAQLTDNTFLVTGTISAIEHLRELLSGTDTEDKISYTIKDLANGLHCELMEPVVDQFKMYLEKVDCKDVAIPLISNVSAQILSSGLEIKDEIIEHSSERVLWAQTIEKLKDYDLFVEIGPGSALSCLIKKHYPEKKVMAINKKADLEQLQELLGIQVEKEDQDEVLVETKKDSCEKTM